MVARTWNLNKSQIASQSRSRAPQLFSAPGLVVRLDLTITGLAKALLDSQIEQEQSTQEIATRLLSH
jgi:hypothetical protein